MNPEAQRIALAEYQGIQCRYFRFKWNNHGRLEYAKGFYSYEDASNYPFYTGETIEEYLDLRNVPDYLNDLNAIHEVESKAGLHNEDFKGRKLKRIWAINIKSLDPRFANASQRCEALLKTLELWVES